VSERWPALMSTSDAAEYLGLSESTLRRLRGGGELSSVRVRGVTRYRRIDLDRFIESLPEGVGESQGSIQ
jgi:excisionase family DNA binding protein